MITYVIKILMLIRTEAKMVLYRAEKKSWYVVARNVYLLLLNFSDWVLLSKI